MTSPSFDRRALWLPLAIPAAAGCIIWTVSTVFPTFQNATIFLSAPAFFLVGAAYLYAAPYILVVALVYRGIQTWPRPKLQRAFLRLPLLLSTTAPLYLAATQLLGDSPQWWDGCAEIFAISVVVAYLYAVAVAVLGSWLAARRALIPSPPAAA